MHPKIKAMIDKSGLKYTTSEGGSFIRATFDVADGRTQMVFIDVVPDTFEGSRYEDFDIFSPICEEANLTPAIALKLLKGIANTKIGAIKIKGGMVGVMVDFRPEGLGVEEFMAIVGLVTFTADNLEAQIEDKGSKDKY